MSKLNVPDLGICVNLEGADESIAKVKELNALLERTIQLADLAINKVSMLSMLPNSLDSVD